MGASQCNRICHYLHLVPHSPIIFMYLDVLDQYVIHDTWWVIVPVIVGEYWPYVLLSLSHFGNTRKCWNKKLVKKLDAA